MCDGTDARTDRWAHLLTLGSGERGVDTSETQVGAEDGKAGAGSRRVAGKMGRWLYAEWLEDGARPFGLGG